MNSDHGASAHADELRQKMIGELWRMGAIRSDRVADVFSAVPRHWFTPGAPLSEVYDPAAAVHVKWDEWGLPISTVSAAQLQAGMLEQAEIQPGMSVLEIGSGGVNAAMMSWLAGVEGAVTTVDIDPDVVERARSLLDAAGFSRVNVLLADAEGGVPDFAPYDRVVVTVSAWDVPPAWEAQLVAGGRIVVPLRMRGLTRSLALDSVDGHLESRSAQVCGFVAMQGVGARVEQVVPLRGSSVLVRFDDGWPADQLPVLDGVLETGRAEVWSGVTVGGSESFDMLQLWLATVFGGFGRLAAEAGQRHVLVDPGVLWFDPAVVEGGSVAYLTARPAAPGVSELGAHAFGPQASALAAAMAGQIRIWDRDQRRAPGPHIAVWPKGTPDEALPEGLVIDKRHRRVTISWPAASAASAGQDTQYEQ